MARPLPVTLATALVAAAALAAPVSPSQAPYALVTLTRQWDGDPHARPRAVVELQAPDGRALWRLEDVVESDASGDGRTVAFVTASYELWLARLPEPPRAAGGSVFTAACAPDGRTVAVQVVGDEGDGLTRLQRTAGIALVDATTLERRLVLEGNDLYAPSFADGSRLFFGSGGPEQLASLWLLDLADGRVARLSNAVPGAPLDLFPSEPPRLAGAAVRYRSDDGEHVVPIPAAGAWIAPPRFELPPPRLVPPGNEDGSISPVRLRRPTTSACTYGGYNIYQYFDHDARFGMIADWACRRGTYDGHRGTDFCQHCGIAVAAPAAGYVVYWYDGCPNYGYPGNGCGYGFGNHVVLLHRDGTCSLEGHGKAGTVVREGYLPCGATVMQSCSSGNSNVEHIHHENWRNLNGRTNPGLAFDPYQGSCDPYEATHWTSQGGYGYLPGAACQ